MTRRTICLGGVALAVVAVLWMGSGAPAQQSASEEGTKNASQAAMLAELKALRVDVDRLMISATYTPEEIPFLEEGVRYAESVFQRVDGLYKVKLRGRESRAQALHALHLAKARLAQAKGDLVQCQEEYKAAAAAAKDAVDAVTAAYATGTVTIDILLRAQSALIDTQLGLSRINRLIALKE